GADAAGIDGSSCVGVGARKIQIGRTQWLEETERIEAGFEIAPAAKSIENAFAVGGCGVAIGGTLSGLRGFRRAFGSESGSVCHQVKPCLSDREAVDCHGDRKRSTNR